MDITPRLAVGRQLVQAYGNGGFQIADIAHQGSVLVLPGRTLEWGVGRFGDITFESLAPLCGETPAVETLLVGTGREIVAFPPDLRAALRRLGIVVDCMDTGAACRTFNVLLTEERRVAAALIAVD